MELERIDTDFSVCQTKDISEINYNGKYCFVGKTDEEISLVCETKDVPDSTVNREDGFRAFRIQGVLDFSLVGILSRIFAVLAENKISVFAVSTYNTDYILLKAEDFERALMLLEKEGYRTI